MFAVPPSPRRVPAWHSLAHPVGFNIKDGPKLRSTGLGTVVIINIHRHDILRQAKLAMEKFTML